MTEQLTRKQLSRPGPTRVPAAVAHDLLRLVHEYEGDARLFLAAAGLPHLNALAEAAPAGSTIGQDDFTALYGRAIAALDVHAARQEGRESLTKAGFDMMCHAVITCRTLRAAIGRMADFSTLLAPRTGLLALEINGGEARLTMATLRSVRNACAYLSDLTGLASYHRLFGWLIGEDLALSGADLRYPRLLERQTVAYLLPSPVQHSAAENGLRFPAHYLDRPVVRSHHELERMLASFPFDIAEPQSKQAPLAERIGHLLSAMLASGEPPARASDLVRQFSISPATLKRRLAAEGTSLAQIKATARRDFAENLLADPRLGVAEVARRAHFSDAGAFRRAFRGWTGLSPSAWRRRLAPVPGAPS